METASALSPPSQQQYLSLDFFSLAGLEAASEFDSNASAGESAASASAADKASYVTRVKSAPGTPLDDPSPISLEPTLSSSGKGHSRQLSRSRSTYDVHTAAYDHDMDVDHANNNSGGSGGSHRGGGKGSATSGGQSGSAGATPSAEQNDHMLGMEISGATYDAIQAGILQHQLESIHMQSPFVSASHPQSPYGMAQMFLTSPSSSNSDQHAGSYVAYDYRQQRKYNVVTGPNGLLTPGPSGEMLPELRLDLMSPMQLEMLSRGDMIEGMENFHAMPLLSPALSQHTNSNYNSPVAQVAFNSASREPTGNDALEQLQSQQRQFQEQLALLQEQQKQLQATAAAVAAASGSPYLTPTQPPGKQGGSSGGASVASMTTPSPGSYFSPLTSPALEPAVSRSAALRAAAAHLSPALHSQQQRAPHPLSALSSPALNPVGSSGGAQQTLSPALGPQSATDIDDPEYLSALQGILDGTSPRQQQNQQQSNAYQGSPVIAAAGSSSSSGPHRSLPAKSRPSPMMKPTNHRSHGRHSSGTSVPTSPMSFKGPPQGGMGFLPPAAIDQRGVQMAQQATSSSTTSTPSPVDLAQIMPPPPVPAQGRPKIPMTPASLMNLSKDSEALTSPTSPEKPAPVPPVRAAAKKASSAIAPAAQQKRGSRLVPASGSAAAKRALAIRPPGGVGVRAATKGAAAAAAAAVEPETRRTSHKAAEQKRRDSLKAGFDELRLLLPPINTEALDPESGEPIPGSSAPRLLPKSSLVPDDNPNRGVSKVALLKFSNEYIVRLHGKVQKRDGYIDRLRDEVRRLRLGGDDEVRGEEGEDLLEMDMLDGEESDFDDDDDDMEIDTLAQEVKKDKVKKSPHLGPTRPPRARAASAKRKEE